MLNHGDENTFPNSHDQSFFWDTDKMVFTFYLENVSHFLDIDDQTLFYGLEEEVSTFILWNSSCFLDMDDETLFDELGKEVTIFYPRDVLPTHSIKLERFNLKCLRHFVMWIMFRITLMNFLIWTLVVLYMKLFMLPVWYVNSSAHLLVGTSCGMANSTFGFFLRQFHCYARMLVGNTIVLAWLPPNKPWILQIRLKTHFFTFSIILYEWYVLKC